MKIINIQKPVAFPCINNEYAKKEIRTITFTIISNTPAPNELPDIKPKQGGENYSKNSTMKTIKL
jgi:hypothetical protein